MPAPDATAQPVRIAFTLTADDLLDGLTEAHRVVRRPWYLRRPFLYALGLVIGVGLASADDPPSFGGSWARLVGLVVGLVVALGVAHLLLRLMNPAKLTHRWSARQLVRGNPMLAQPLTATVTDDGIQVASAAAESAVRWSQYPFHGETPKSFVLLASDRMGASALVLPKRAMGESDVAGLRALLAAHTRRLG
ncbi:YcxB family protein [Micromonospora soli]|uniref:YcxB family protein n=1 Tax=Micromonospora sp. NBRC 110009 TaxID=3061627 RepID=UPI0026722086|nr:YcxB family protein [Micromonospora sp. NBRC 110009]WKT99831.1 YcxB family protein [Micromonospora sp. NBRC 110009]